MKKCLYLLVAFFAGMSIAVAQVSNNNEDGVYRHNSHSKNYAEGELIVKFSDDSRVNIKQSNGAKFVSASSNDIDVVLKEIGTFEMTQLMPLTGGKVQKGMKKAFSSNRMVHDVDLSQLYCVKFDKEKMSVEQAIAQIKSLSNVEYAQPNYIVHICSNTEEGNVYSDPLISQQWGIPAINLPKLWSAPKVTNRRPVIAIIDTGVDISHPDLEDNIWTNPAEGKGETGYDDDNNGFIDDVHGWDFVNDVPISATEQLGRDRHGHGTHCAGIAAACANNGIGVVGANPNAYIMPVKVLADDGITFTSIIIRGIDYAIANGADILSMSLGSISYDRAEEEAILKGYTNGVVCVAAAGNDAMDIYERGLWNHSGLSFPGALDCVIGVMASDRYGNRASFSNYDSDGPFYSVDKEYFNYDVMAPGVGIISTYPGGQYRELSGTSMATPLVAGTISALLQYRGFDYAMDAALNGDMQVSANDVNGVFDVSKAMALDNESRGAIVRLVSFEIDDKTLGNGNGIIDAGETVDLYPVIRTWWGTAYNLKMHLDLDSTQMNNPQAEIITNDVDFGYSLSASGTLKGKNPIRIKINDGCKDRYKLKLVFSAIGENIYDELKQKVEYKVSNQTVLNAFVNEDMTLYPDKHYVIDRPLAVPQGVTLTILPGTTLKFKNGAGLNCEGKLIAKGTPDNMITFTKADDCSGYCNIYMFSANLEDTLEFVDFNGFYKSYQDGNYAIFHNMSFLNCVIRDNNSGEGLFNNCKLNKTNMFNNLCSFYHFHGDRCVECNIIGNGHIDGYKPQPDLSDYPNLENMCNSNIMFNKTYFRDNTFEYVDLGYYTPYVSKQQTETPCYLGSSREDIVRKRVYDIYADIPNAGFGQIDLSNMLTVPNKEAHGIVWKVVVDGYDTQDDFENMPSLSLGRHKFDIYFNRPMDKETAPSVTFGLREPYTQKKVVEDATWNEDATVYTAYFTIDGKTGCDGLNHIVISGARDNEYFDCPKEDIRFNFLIQSIGSLNTGLVAEAGLGKVKLTWKTDEEDFADLMGYNLYRYTEHEETSEGWGYNEEGEYGYWEMPRTVRDTVIVNNNLLLPSETELIDYDVIPGTTYYYMIKEMGTDMQQHDISNVVAATPLTATKGDANGSMAVDIADVVTEVNYLTGLNPQPFIFEAADVNSDETVNILDVVGTVNIIITPKGTGIASADATATYTVEDGILYVDSDTPLGGVQVSIKANADTEFEALEGLDGMEQAGVWVNEEEYMLLAYSMSGKVISSGKQPLMRIGTGEVADMVASDVKGHNVLAINGTATSISNLPFGIEEYEGAEVRYYDLMGRMISAEAARKGGVAIQSLFINGNCVKSYKILNK